LVDRYHLSLLAKALVHRGARLAEARNISRLRRVALIAREQRPDL